MDSVLVDLGVIRDNEDSIRSDLVDKYHALESAKNAAAAVVCDKGRRTQRVQFISDLTDICSLSTDSCMGIKRSGIQRSNIAASLNIRSSSSVSQPSDRIQLDNERQIRNLMMEAKNERRQRYDHANELRSDVYDEEACFTETAQLSEGSHASSDHNFAFDGSININGESDINKRSIQGIQSDEVCSSGAAAVSSSIRAAPLVCPICSKSFEPEQSSRSRSSSSSSNRSLELLMEKHVDRCLRRGSNVRAKKYIYEEEDDELEEDDADVVETSDVRSSIVDTRGAKGKPKKAIGKTSGDIEGVESNGSLSTRYRKRLRSNPTDDSVKQVRSKSTNTTTESSSKLNDVINGCDASSEDDARTNTRSLQRRSSALNDTDSEDATDGLIDTIDMTAIVDDWEEELFCGRLKRFVRASADLKGGLDEDDSPSVTNELPEGSFRCVVTDFATEAYAPTWTALHDYQRLGCRWMHELWEQGVGGILGDEMGLGKTAQICTHFGSLALLQSKKGSSNNRRNKDLHSKSDKAIFAIVCPATILHHWLQEMHRWCPFVRTVVLHAASSTAAELLRVGNDGIMRVLNSLMNKPSTRYGLAVIMTYEGMRKYKASLCSIAWTAVCLDEGQKIKNPHSDITATCKMLPAFHRIILSGTPIQNSLVELWSLFDFVYPGRLGSLPVFELEFATPIRLGGYARADKFAYELAIRCAKTLQSIVRPYLLRRKKDDLMAVTKLPPKTEQVLFCQISPKQREIYLNILSSSEVKAVIEKRMVAFRAISVLRKLCNHPSLVLHDGTLDRRVLIYDDNGKNGSGTVDEDRDEGEDADEDDFCFVNKTGGRGIVWGESGKLLVLSKLLPLWHLEGHKVLVFCQTRGMLGIIESMVRELGFRYERLDGSTPVGKRAGIVHKFNSDESIFVMLLTTRTGGVGISLTAANRVILFDPDWNPMTDMQSRERAWRLGQTREVTIYRLITRGTIEEKIYQRQIFKVLLSNRILENANQKSLFSQNLIRELFELNDAVSDASNALPAGGAMDLASSNDDYNANQSEHGGEGNSDGNQAKDNHSDRNSSGAVDVEDYVEQALCPEAVGLLQADLDCASTDGSNSRDRRLLEALFAGEAITTVYNHEYLLEPAEGNAGEQRVIVKAEADRAINKAIYNLSSSAKVYSNSSSSSTTRPATYSSYSDVTSSTSPTEEAPSRITKPRFGATSATGDPTRSSSYLLFGAPPASTATTSSSSSSISSDITCRLQSLFSKPQDRLSTAFVLSKFKDLGDQYAPLFRDLLRSVAVHKEGAWMKR